MSNHTVFLLLLVGVLLVIWLYYTYWAFKASGLRADYYRDNYLRYGRSREAEKKIIDRLKELLILCIQRPHPEHDNLAEFIQRLNESDWSRFRYRAIDRALRKMDTDRLWTSFENNQIQVHDLFIRYLIDELGEASPAKKQVLNWLGESSPRVKVTNERSMYLVIINYCLLPFLLAYEHRNHLIVWSAIVYGAIGWYFDFAENGITVTGVEIYDAVFIVLWWPSYLLFWFFVGLIAVALSLLIVKIAIEKCLKLLGIYVEPKD